MSDPQSSLLALYRKRKSLQDLYPEAARGDLLGLTEYVAAFLEFGADIEKSDPELGSLKKWLGQYKEFIGVPPPVIANGMRHTIMRHELVTEIAAHLPTLFILTKELKLSRVLELGVESGNSTIALLEAASQINGHVWSIDIRACEEAGALVRRCGLESYWTFIQGNDLAVEWKEPIDHLFIDSHHIYPHTLAELNKFEPFVSPGGLISLHDSFSFPGVNRAVRKYFEGRRDITIYEYRNSHGLLLLRKTKNPIFP
jgi:predicted O-methyltransferase YrrM